MTCTGSAPVNSTSPLRYQSKSGPTSSEGSAMNPPSDIDACMTTLLMQVLPLRAGKFIGGCRLDGLLAAYTAPHGHHPDRLRRR